MNTLRQIRDHVRLRTRLRELMWLFKPAIKNRQFKVAGIPLYLNPYDNAISRKMFVRGQWEPLETAQMQQQATAGSICIDIGANIGFYSLALAQAVGPAGRVFAFEPSSENYAYLSRNSAAYPAITTERMAISDHVGEFTLYLSGDNKGDHRIYQPPSEQSRPSETVHLMTLDHYVAAQAIPVDRISVIKMDTQGAEPRIFKGMQKLIKALNRTALFVEFWPPGYQEQTDIDAMEYLRFLWNTFTIHVVIETQRASRPIASLDALMQLYQDHLHLVDGVDNSTLIMRTKASAV